MALAVLGGLAAAPALAQQGDQAPSADEGLAAFAPERAAGWVRVDQTHHRNPDGPDSLWQMIYEKDGFACPVSLVISSHREFKEALRKEVESSRNNSEEDVEERKQAGGSLYLINKSEGPVLVGMLGEVGVVIGPEDCTVENPEAMRRGLLDLYEAMGPQRIAKFKPEGSVGPTLEAPEGFSRASADIGGVRIALAHPEDWAFKDMTEVARFLGAVTVSRDPAAIDSIFGDGVEISTGSDNRVDLGTSDNVAITIKVVGSKVGPKEFLAMMMDPEAAMIGERICPREFQPV